MDSGVQFCEVLESARAGDQEAIGVLYSQLNARVLAYLRAHVRQDCEDVASEVWLSVARNLHAFSGDESDFRCWVFTIARRRVADWCRSAPRLAPTTSPFPLDELPESAVSGPDWVVENLTAHEMLAKLADRLPEEQARVLVLRVVAGLSTEEVAKVVEKSAGAVRMLLHRALKVLAPLAEELFEISSEEA